MRGTLRQLDHCGGVIQHCAWGRCGYNALRRRALQIHLLPGARWALQFHLCNHTSCLWLLVWVVFTPCAQHEAQNALTWALKPESDDADLMNTVFVDCTFVRGSMDAIVAYIGEWVSACFYRCGRLGEVEKDTLRCLWMTLGMEGELVHLLVVNFELHCRAVRLCVRSDIYPGDRDKLIVSTLIAIPRCRKFCDKRWFSVGKGGSGMVAMLLTGLGSLFESASKAPSVPGDYLNGIAGRARSPERSWRQPPWSPQARKLRRRQCVASAMHHLADLPWPGLQALRPGTCSPSVSRPVTVQSPLFASGSSATQRSCIAPSARANVGSTCSVSLRGPASCLVYIKAWELMETQRPKRINVRVVTLLGGVSWAVGVVEQLHASAVVISRFHPEYSLATLLVRSMALVVSKHLPRLRCRGRRS